MRLSTSDPLVAADDDPTLQQDVYLYKDGVISLLRPGLASSVSLDLVGATDSSGNAWSAKPMALTILKT